MKRLLYIILFIFLFAFSYNDSFGEVTGPPAEGFGPLIDPSQYKIKWLDVAYSNESKTQKLDIYLPEGKGPFPLLIAVHGGAWEMGDKNDGQVTPIMAVVKHGYAVASVNYRLTDEASFPAQIYDVKAAIRFLRANTKTYNLIADKFAIWGNSAGGHLAGLAGTSGDVAEAEDLNMGNKAQSSRVQAVITWFGGFDLGAMGVSDPLVKLFGSAPADAPELVKKANPATYISVDDPPFFVEHGSKDSLVPVKQSIDFASELTKALGENKVKLKIFEGADHGDKAFETPQNLKEVVEFLDKTLK